MKNRIYKRLLINSTIFISITIFIVGCKVGNIHYKTGETTAFIKLPAETKRIIVLNRTKPIQQGTLLKMLDGKNLFYEEREGVNVCLKGTKDALWGNNKYISEVSTKTIEAPQSNNFPPPLSTNQLNGIITQYTSAVITSLEIFNTTIDKENPIYFITADKKTGRKIACHRIPLTIGWRMYNLVNGAVLDEYKVEKILEVKAEEIKDTLNKLPLYGVELKKVATQLGTDYVKRFLTSSIYEYRTYFKKGNKDLEEASVKLKTGEWGKAKEIYVAQSKNANAISASRALYNLAVCAEREGDFLEAIELAEKSNTLHKNKYSSTYVNELKYRLNKK